MKSCVPFILQNKLILIGTAYFSRPYKEVHKTRTCNPGKAFDRHHQVVGITKPDTFEGFKEMIEMLVMKYCKEEVGSRM